MPTLNHRPKKKVASPKTNYPFKHLTNLDMEVISYGFVHITLAVNSLGKTGIDLIAFHFHTNHIRNLTIDYLIALCNKKHNI